MRFEEIENKDGFYITFALPGSLGELSDRYGVIFTAIKPCEVMEVNEVHKQAGSSGSDVTLNIERLQGTEALDGGDEILTTAFNLKGTANTVQSRSGSQLQNRVLNVGDRLALKDAGTLTAVLGPCVTIYLRPLGKGDYR